MMKKSLLISILSHYFLYFISFFFLVGCPNMPPDNENPNPIFPSAELILVTTPSMGEITSNMPDFAWEATGEPIVYLGIFNKNISVSNNKILNPEANIWAWHTGLGTGREGSVYFSDGRNVNNGDIIENGIPTPLISGESYLWAVWAWDSSGQEIIRSSTEIYFEVE